MTEEQVEAWRKAFSPNVTTNIAEINAVKSEIDKLCDLALRGLRTMPRPIEEAPKEGVEHCLVKGGSRGEQWRYYNFLDMPFYRVEAANGTPILAAPTHFIPLKALETE